MSKRKGGRAAISQGSFKLGEECGKTQKGREIEDITLLTKGKYEKEGKLFPKGDSRG